MLLQERFRFTAARQRLQRIDGERQRDADADADAAHEQREPRSADGVLWLECAPNPLISGEEDLLRLKYVAPRATLEPLLCSSGSDDWDGDDGDQVVDEEELRRWLALTASGRRLPSPDSGAEEVPTAWAYCGLQFGSFAGQLGDGAAVSLGEILGQQQQQQPTGKWTFLEAQLKGVGPTQFTRAGLSGRKRLRELLREAAMMEILGRLDVPTTSAVAVVVAFPPPVASATAAAADATDGASAAMLRVGATFIRFGSFEVTMQAHPNGKCGPSRGNTGLLMQLADWCIDAYYPTVRGCAEAEDDEAVYREFALAVTAKTAKLCACWMGEGWCHGALNSDNLSIAGETLDHGSGAFVPSPFHASFWGNSTDVRGLYAFEKQPAVCESACVRLAEALQPLHCERMEEVEPLVRARFAQAYEMALAERMRDKLGWRASDEPTARADYLAVLELFEAVEKDGVGWREAVARLGRSTLEKTDVLSEASKAAAAGSSGDAPTMSVWEAKHRHRQKVTTVAAHSVVAIPTKAEIEAAIDAALHGDIEFSVPYPA